MSKEISDLVKEINKNHKEIYQIDTKLNKEISHLSKDISGIKKEVAIIISKLDIILDMIMAMTVFIEESAEIGELDNDDEDYESNEGWIPDNEEWRNSLEDDDDIEN